ncbi:hypothetical protein GCM10010197_19140 [Nocardioides luteus]|uniref:Uncharacterized protein n=1 Tax=Nocardioides luteus TaxID=1844 RepID=A0ABQ5T0M8_9ACTN|nr:hypothetical protein GCM10010197_19140 [Nocardioides luteus]GLJ69830.1 hypothetical protein GCM10017579_38660 [Nocardioides luteus]
MEGAPAAPKVRVEPPLPRSDSAHAASESAKAPAANAGRTLRDIFIAKPRLLVDQSGQRPGVGASAKDVTRITGRRRARHPSHHSDVGRAECVVIYPTETN